MELKKTDYCNENFQPFSVVQSFGGDKKINLENVSKEMPVEKFKSALKSIEGKINKKNKNIKNFKINNKNYKGDNIINCKDNNINNIISDYNKYINCDSNKGGYIFNNNKKCKSAKNIDNDDIYDNNNIGDKKHASGNIEKDDDRVECGGGVEDGEIVDDCDVIDDDIYDEIFINNKYIDNNNTNSDNIKNVVEKSVENTNNNDKKLEKTDIANKKNVVNDCVIIDNDKSNNKDAYGTNDLTKKSNSRSRSSSSSSSGSSSSSSGSSSSSSGSSKSKSKSKSKNGSRSSSSSDDSSSSGGGSSSSKSRKSRSKGKNRSSSNTRELLEGFTKEINGMKNELTVKETQISELCKEVEYLKNQMHQQNTKIAKLSNQLSNYEKNIASSSKCESSNTRSIFDHLFTSNNDNNNNNNNVPRSSNARENNNNPNNNNNNNNNPNGASDKNRFVDNDIGDMNSAEETERKRKSMRFPNFPTKKRRIEFREDRNDNKEYKRHIDETRQTTAAAAAHDAVSQSSMRDQYNFINKDDNRYGKFFGVVIRSSSIIDVDKNYDFAKIVDDYLEELKNRHQLWFPPPSKIFRYKYKDSAVLQFSTIDRMNRFLNEFKNYLKDDPYKPIIYECSFDLANHLQEEKKNNQIDRYWSNQNGEFSVSFYGEPTPNFYLIKIPWEYFNIKKNREMWYHNRYNRAVGGGGGSGYKG